MEYRYRVGCSIENLKGVRDFIRTSLRKHHVADLEISEVVLALDEMCSNLMIHAHHCNPDDLFDLTIQVQPEPDKPVIFEIIDTQEAFDINQFSEPDLTNIIHQKRKGGLGIRLVKSIMDKIEYENTPGKNVCRLFKSLRTSA